MPVYEIPDMVGGNIRNLELHISDESIEISPESRFDILPGFGGYLILVFFILCFRHISSAHFLCQYKASFVVLYNDGRQ